ncbi:hypothetical protein BH09BAC3_BH09BAC3_01850 [soil metagenome]
MNKLQIILFLVSAAVIEDFAQDKVPENCELAAVVVADGVADEWPLAWVDDDDKKFSYTICSDNNNLYIRMRTNDEMVRQKIAWFGLTVWLDPNGKKKRKLGLHFPSGVESKERLDKLRATEDSRKDMNANQRDQFKKDINKSMISDLEVLELIGLADKPLTSTRSGITNGIKVAIAAQEDGSYVYESVIPFKSFRLSKVSLDEMLIGFETGKYVPPPVKNSNPSSGMGSGMGMGGGGMGSGMQGGGYRGGVSSPYMASTNIWVSVKFK